MLQEEHSAILLTFIKPPFVIKIFVLSNFEWLLETGFTVLIALANTEDLREPAQLSSLIQDIIVGIHNIMRSIKF